MPPYQHAMQMLCDFRERVVAATRDASDDKDHLRSDAFTLTYFAYDDDDLVAAVADSTGDALMQLPYRWRNDA